MKTCFVTCALKNHFPGLEKLVSSISQAIDSTGSDLCVISPDEVKLDGVKFFSSHPKKDTYEGINSLPHKHYDTSRWYPATWYKFEAFGMRGYDRVIYLDSDMLAVKDISELATDEKLNTRPIWFTLNPEEEDKRDSNIFYNPDLHKRITSYRRTVSTGIMVINMDQISKFTRQGLIYLAEVGRTYDGTDQGVVNQWLEEKEINFGVLGKEYNHLATNKIEDDTKIIHYFGRKPWDSGNDPLTIIPDTSDFRVENDELWREYEQQAPYGATLE